MKGMGLFCVLSCSAVSEFQVRVGFPGGSVVNNPSANAGDAGLTPLNYQNYICGDNTEYKMIYFGPLQYLSFTNK